MGLRKAEFDSVYKTYRNTESGSLGLSGPWKVSSEVGRGWRTRT